MKISILAVAALLAAAWSAVPLARAHDKDDKPGAEDGDHDHDRDDGQRGGPGGGGWHGGGPGGPGGMMGGMHHEPDPEMKAKFEKMRDLEKKAGEAARKIRSAGTDAEKTAAKAEAKKAIGELLDAKNAMDEEMISKMEKHLAERKAKIAKRKANRDKVIETRLAHMTGEADDWD